AFAVNQMADNIERAPTFFTFISERPRFRQIAQKRIESSGGASEKRYCVLQVMFHHGLQLIDSSFRDTLILSVLRRMPQRPTLVMALCNRENFTDSTVPDWERCGQYCLWVAQRFQRRRAGPRFRGRIYFKGCPALVSPGFGETGWGS